ncbi:GxxExxY protein [Verrucomicrobiales bacterium]|nr:GxxExxY protein [Verrucomicrobiales bacterium]
MKLDEQELPHVLAGVFLDVHRHVGPGLLADAYKACVAHELRMREIIFERDAPLGLTYKGLEVPVAGTHDFIVEDIILINVVAVDAILPIHKEKLQNQLRISGRRTGFLVNFNVPLLRDGGIKRIIVSKSEPALRFKVIENPVSAVDSRSKSGAR